MNGQVWRQLDPRDLQDWPFAAQLCFLSALLIMIGLLAFALLWRDDLEALRTGEAQRVALEQQIAQSRRTQAQLTPLGPWLPRKGLGCPWQEIRTLADGLHLTLLMGTDENEAPHDALIEAMRPLQLDGDYPRLAAFVTRLLQADSPWRLEPFNLTQASGKQLELQADARCIKPTGPQVPT